MEGDQYRVYALCRDCTEWSLLIGNKENYGTVTNKANCEHCGSSRLDPQSTTSERTFDAVRAKARSARVKKENLRRRRF